MDKEQALQLALDYDAAVEKSERRIDFAERCKRGEDYYVGLQTWTDEQKAELQREGKPVMVINEILPTVNNVTSTERDNRKDIKVVKRRGGYESVAALLTEISKHIMDQSRGKFVKSEVFLDGVRGVRGWYKVEIDKDSDPVNGQIKIRSRPPLSIRSDPTCLTYDLNDPKGGARFVIDSEYRDRDKLKTEYPDKAKMIDEAIQKYISNRGRGFIQRAVDYMFNLTPSSENDSEVLFDHDIMQKWRARVHETWIKEYVSRTLVCNKETWEIWWFDPKKKKDKAKIDRAKAAVGKDPDKYYIREKQSMPLLHKVVRIGDLLLEHKENPFNGMMMFPLIPFSPFGQAQYDMGMIDNLIGPQDEMNKRITNATHILNSSANAGHIVASLSENPDYKNTLRSFGSSPGFIVELDKCGGSYRKIEPNKAPDGHLKLVGMNRNFIEEVSGVSGANRGLDPDRQESGRLYRAKVQRSLATNQIIYDRFDHSTAIMSQTVVELARNTDTYTEKEIGFLIEDKNLVRGDLLDSARQQVMAQNPPPRPPTENEIFSQLQPEQQKKLIEQFKQIVVQYQQQVDTQAVQLAKVELFKQYKAYRTGKYSVVVISSPLAPTTQISNFFEVEALKDVVPPEILAPELIMTTNIPQERKDEMIRKMETAGQVATRQ